MKRLFFILALTAACFTFGNEANAQQNDNISKIVATTRQRSLNNMGLEERYMYYISKMIEAQNANNIAEVDRLEAESTEWFNGLSKSDQIKLGNLLDQVIKEAGVTTEGANTKELDEKISQYLNEISAAQYNSDQAKIQALNNEFGEWMSTLNQSDGAYVIEKLSQYGNLYNEYSQRESLSNSTIEKKINNVFARLLNAHTEAEVYKISADFEQWMSTLSPENAAYALEYYRAGIIKIMGKGETLSEARKEELKEYVTNISISIAMANASGNTAEAKRLEKEYKNYVSGLTVGEATYICEIAAEIIKKNY